MRISRHCLCSQAFLAALAFPAFAVAQGPGAADPHARPAAESPQFRTKTATSLAAARMVPLDALSPNLRDRVKKVITQPTLVTHAPAEEFLASPKMYRWLMDHPDRAAAAWQRLGIPCSPITDRGQGRFGWSDNQGSDVVWSTIAESPRARVWYAEGQVHPGALMPTIPVRAVVVIRYHLPDGEQGKIQHEIDVFCHADSRAAHVAYRLFGPQADHMAEQASEQLLLFFSVLSRYLAQHPDQAEKMLAPAPPVRAASR
jgi:hypothetical protein